MIDFKDECWRPDPNEHGPGLHHFLADKTCGVPGPLTSALMAMQGGREFDNIHMQLLAVLQRTSLEQLVRVYETLYVSRLRLPHIHTVDDSKDRLKIPCYRTIGKGMERDLDCCGIVERLLAEEVPKKLEEVIEREGSPHLISRWSCRHNNWWNYKETLDGQVRWKYRFSARRSELHDFRVE